MIPASTVLATYSAQVRRRHPTGRASRMPSVCRQEATLERRPSSRHEGSGKRRGTPALPCYRCLQNASDYHQMGVKASGPGLLKKTSMLYSMFVSKDFLTWFLIGWNGGVGRGCSEINSLDMGSSSPFNLSHPRQNLAGVYPRTLASIIQFLLILILRNLVLRHTPFIVACLYGITATAIGILKEGQAITLSIVDQCRCHHII